MPLKKTKVSKLDNLQLIEKKDLKMVFSKKLQKAKN